MIWFPLPPNRITKPTPFPRPPHSMTKTTTTCLFLAPAMETGLYSLCDCYFQKLLGLYYWNRMPGNSCRKNLVLWHCRTSLARAPVLYSCILQLTDFPPQKTNLLHPSRLKNSAFMLVWFTLSPSIVWFTLNNITYNNTQKICSSLQLFLNKTWCR